MNYILFFVSAHTFVPLVIYYFWLFEAMDRRHLDFEKADIRLFPKYFKSVVQGSWFWGSMGFYHALLIYMMTRSPR